jgi:hypothetical protein
MKSIFLASLLLIGNSNVYERSEDGVSIESLWRLFKEKRFEIVLEKSREQLNENPDNLNLQLIVGRTLADTDRFQESSPYFEKILKRSFQIPATIEFSTPSRIVKNGFACTALDIDVTFIAVEFIINSNFPFR